MAVNPPSQSIEAMLDTLVTCTSEVFETMVGTTLTADAPRNGETMNDPCGVMGLIAFVGDYSGSVTFYSDEETAVTITSTMMGMAAADVTDEMADVVGEITNMVAGTLRTRMADQGIRWGISTPSVTVGRQLRTKHYGTVHTGLCHFAMASGGSFVIELVLSD